MTTLWLKDILKNWDDATWISSWATAGAIRELCEKNISEEGEHWYFVNHVGYKTESLPAGVCFRHDEDATRFKLML